LLSCIDSRCVWQAHRPIEIVQIKFRVEKIGEIILFFSSQIDDL
jgi:hypothetical protein